MFSSSEEVVRARPNGNNKLMQVIKYTAKVGREAKIKKPGGPSRLTRREKEKDAKKARRKSHSFREPSWETRKTARL